MSNRHHNSPHPVRWYVSIIAAIGVIVPRRLRSDWRQEWEAELTYREMMLADWNKLNWRNKFDLVRRSVGAFWDALWMQPQRLEDEMFQDVRFGLRTMLRNPMLTFVAVTSLALGIGANTAIFSIVNGLILRPLPYKEPDRLMKVYQAQPDPTKGMLPSIWAYPRFQVLRDQSQSFSAIAGVTQNTHNLTGTDEPERLQVEMVSASYFSLLGIDPVVGRSFAQDEDHVPGINLTALLGHGLWQRRYGGDPQILGRTLELDKHLFTIAGVLPPGFKGQDGTAEVWVTMMAAPLLRFSRTLTSPNNYWFQVIARLKDGVTIEQAQSEMELVTAQIEQRFPAPQQTLPGRVKTVTVAPLSDAKLDPAIRKSFLILLASVGLVLLIACANTANLLLARALARRKEFALRAVLGAGRPRLIRQLLTESVLLALLGGALGIVVAGFALQLLKDFRPSDNAQFWTAYTRTFDFFTIEIDWRVLTFNFGLAGFTGILFGLIPALQSSFTNVTESLKERAGSSAKGFRSLRKISGRGLLVVAEVALSLVLLTGAGLMIKSMARLQAVDLGFSPDNVLTMAVPSRDAKPELYQQLLERVQKLPGVESASLGSTAPLLGYASKTIMDIQGQSSDGAIGVGIHSVSPDFFATLRIPLLKGRTFTQQDRIGAPRVAVINQTAADNLFAGQDPLGKRIRPYVDPVYETREQFVEIVGVAGNAQYMRPQDKFDSDIYLCSQQPTDAAQTLIVRSTGDFTALVEAVRAELLAIDKNVPLSKVQTMTDRASEVTSRTRFVATMLSLFAALAVVLAASGIYGVMGYNVSARTREMGIRIALGAEARDVLRLVMRDGLVLVGIGLVLGLVTSWAGSRILTGQLYEVRADDPPTFVAVALVLAATAVLACYFPARRATKTDPLVAIRWE
jgi:putative ABC transport system permease protein